MKHRRTAISVVTVVALAGSGVAMAHPGHGDGFSDQELFPGEGVLGDKQHGLASGHLPPKQENVAVIGKAGLDAPAGTDGDMTGRVADVAAFGDYAYLTSFRAADCLGGGAWIVDISDPTAPVEAGFMPTTDGNYAGEGAQVIDVEFGPFAGRQLFLHQNETCDPFLAEDTGKDRFLGGINIWDVTDPLNPELLVEHAGDDDDVRQNPNTVHSMFAWNSHVDEKVYAVLVDNEEFTDVDIMDITDPANPVMINDTLDLVDQFGVGQDEPDNLTSIFNHDMMVYRKGARYVMNVNYWDGGYVLLDVTDPTPGNVTLIAESDYALLDEERLKRGHEIAPEGNAHQSEFSPDFRFLIGTDEDFSPYRITHAEITSGPFAGAQFNAAMAGDARPVTEEEPLDGTPTFVGLACDPSDVPAGSGIALIERGVCAFQDKLDNVQAAGYTSGIVFNSPVPGCNSLLNMLAVGDIPFLFVARETGLMLLGVDAAGDAACESATPDVGTPSAEVLIEAEFAGWGYVRLFRTKVPGAPGQPGSITQTDTYAIPEAQDPEFAIGYGDLSVHEVAVDPRKGSGLAYFSYYAGGFRVAEYGNRGIQEVGAFIDEGGNNFWGVEVHKHNDGQYYVLASDRDFGLYIFQYTGKIRGR
ncbi:PA domain-containing protein [Phytoactinopolyspora mesophila]|nr:PA domain-containing protein [Phytoactinopolyspora mesophila]